MRQQRKIAIKAGSSIFQNETAFEHVADLLVPLAEEAQVFFVVSALRGETDRTIDSIAGDDRAILNEALNGRMTDYAQQWNNPDIAAQLVRPENYCVRELMQVLQRRGIAVRGLQHGPEYPLLGVDNNHFLYATPDVSASRRIVEAYSERIIVVPGFGVRNKAGQVMCTGRGSSDLTLTQFAELFSIDTVVYWKDSGGVWRYPEHPELGIIPYMTREEARARGNEKILDRRVFDFQGPIVVTYAGQVKGGTYIAPQMRQVMETSCNEIRM